jgi:putative PIN family toxin of toxin-antitoxin system
VADRVVFDTNVLISAALWPRGAPFQVTLLAADGRLRHTTSRFILDEVADVLVRKFKAPTRFVSDVVGAVMAYSTLITP